MPENPGMLINTLTKNQFSRISLGELLGKLTQIVPASWKLLNINVDRYKQIPMVASSLPQDTDLKEVYQAVAEIFPTFPLIVSSQLKSQSQYLTIGQQFLISGIGSLITQYQEHNIHIQQFLNNIDLRVEFGSPPQKRTSEAPYLPRLVYGDLILIAKGLNWKPSQKSHEMIESLYCINGLSQFFLRYYFDLIASAENDEYARQIHDIFYNFFANIRLQESHYWQRYASKVKGQIEQIIAQDSTNRHPILRKPCFEQIEALHPLIHSGNARPMTKQMKGHLEKQLHDLHSFSLRKTLMWFQVVAKSKTPEYLRYLILQIAKQDQGKIVEFHQFFQTLEPAEALLEIQQVLAPIAQKIAPDPPKTVIFEDEMTKRLKKAQKNIAERAHIAAITSDQMTNYLKKYFEKLYERSAKEGALTHHDIEQYLANINQHAASIMKQRPITVKEKQVFEESIDQVFDQLGGHFSETEMEELQGKATEAIENLTPDAAEKQDAPPEEPTEGMETLEEGTTTENEIEALQQTALEDETIYRETLALEIPFDDNPDHLITIERLLEQPISMGDKMKFLQLHTPHPISQEMMEVVEKKQQFCFQGSSNPISIFKKDALLTTALVRLLFPQNPLRKLMQKKIIPILPDPHQPLLTVREFLTFPFAENKQGPAEEEEWFNQHIFYLELAHAQNQLDEANLNRIKDHLEDIPVLKYKKYFNIIRHKKFDETTFMAVYSLWENNGLSQIRIFT